MNEMERFKAMVRMEEPDYWPLLAAHALSTPHAGGMVKLHREGLPERVKDLESWCRYWGECTFDVVRSISVGAPGVKSASRIEDGFEVIGYETGACTRQVLNNDLVYIMSDFQEFNVCDRDSWDRYRSLMTPPHADFSILDAWRGRYAERTRPLVVHCGGT